MDNTYHPLKPSKPSKPADYKIAKYDRDEGYSCHLCFKCSPYSDSFPPGDHWPCDEHMNSDSWNCILCKKYTWNRWDRSNKCQFCNFSRYDSIQSADPMVRIKNKSCICLDNMGQLIEMHQQDADIDMVLGQWKQFLPESVMDKTCITINGFGDETYHHQTIALQEIYRIISTEPCTLGNIIAVKLYSILAEINIGAKDIILDVDNYYQALGQCRLPK